MILFLILDLFIVLFERKKNTHRSDYPTSAKVGDIIEYRLLISFLYPFIC